MIFPRAAFVDSQGWMAIANRRDQAHSAITEAYLDLGSRGWKLYTSNWTAYEALSHIRERAKNGGYEAAVALRRTLDTQQVILLPVTKGIERRAQARFWAAKDKDWSMTVCANLEIMGDANVIYVLSAATAYEEAGLILLVKSGLSGMYLYNRLPVGI
jgi:predicted nucleic acid-binding protein